MMAPHQKERIEAFLHPDDPTLKGNYQVMQSLIAIGSGGMTGKGLYNGTQNQEGFLPVQESDFIYAVIGEEIGVIGMGIVILLYALFLIRMIILARDAKDFYGTLIVIGVMSMFAYQIIQNIGMTVAVIPVTGVTLPFISYGGSSLLTSLANLGLVLNVGMRRKKINF
jgi:rod shape determining protein RodA